MKEKYSSLISISIWRCKSVEVTHCLTDAPALNRHIHPAAEQEGGLIPSPYLTSKLTVWQIKLVTYTKTTLYLTDFGVFTDERLIEGRKLGGVIVDIQYANVHWYPAALLRVIYSMSENKIVFIKVVTDYVIH